MATKKKESPLSPGEVRAVVALRNALKRRNRFFDRYQRTPNAHTKRNLDEASALVGIKESILRSRLLGCPDGSPW